MKMYYTLIAALLLNSSAVFAMGDARSASLPALEVRGAEVVETTTGKPVTLRGVSLCSLAWHSVPKTLQSLIDDGWQANIVRLPVQRSVWEKVGAEIYLRDRLDPAVKACTEKGFYCVVDWHDIAEWNTPETDAALRQFWTIAAPRYASHPQILYEVFNEPTKPTARTHENWLRWRNTAQSWVDLIRQYAPNTPILVGSPHWAQMPHFAVQSPFEGKNLLYTAHIYPQFKPPSWEEIFGVAAQTIPIFLSEWGWTSHESEKKYLYYSTREAYGDPLKRYLDKRPNIHWTAWSYDQLCAPSMQGKDRDDMGQFVKEWLAEEVKPAEAEVEGNESSLD